MIDGARELDVEPGRQRRAFLLPREHGAYVELGFSVTTALALGRITSTKLLLTASVVTLFLAHEPLLVLIGERGKRRLDQTRPRAVATAALLIGVGGVLGLWGWWQAPPESRIAVLLPLALGGMLMAMILNHREKSAFGEILVALTFASALIPIALAGEAHPADALNAGALWAVIFILQTFAVREVRGRRKDQIFRLFSVVWLSAGVFVIVSLLISLMDWLPGAALLPTIMIAALCGLLRVSPRRLRTVGWAFAVSDLLSLFAMLAVLR
jgi:YwiC-like protein